MIIDESYVKRILVKRKRDAHKGDFGRVLIYAGSVGMAGAAVLCARAALRTGAGLVQYLLTSFKSPLYPILQTAVPEATCVRLSENSLQQAAFGQAQVEFSDSGNAGIIFNLDRYDAVVAGCGLGQTEEQRRILGYILENYSGILLLDADALNMIAADAAVLHDEAPYRSKTVCCSDKNLYKKLLCCRAQIIITPHLGEAKRLLAAGTSADRKDTEGAGTEMAAETSADRKDPEGAGTEMAAVGPGSTEKLSEEDKENKREAMVRELAEKYRAVAVLKGAGTLVMDGTALADAVDITDKVCPGGPFTDKGCLGGPLTETSMASEGASVKAAATDIIYKNTTGNPGMATAGSGDVLAGVIGALAAQKYKASDAARAGVFIHGLAGDLAAEALTEMSVTASDIVDNLPGALKKIQR